MKLAVVENGVRRYRLRDCFANFDQNAVDCHRHDDGRKLIRLATASSCADKCIFLLVDSLLDQLYKGPKYDLDICLRPPSDFGEPTRERL